MPRFPTPVGGTAFPEDFVPSVVFAGLYAILLPLIIYRIFSKGSRNALILNAASFSIERVVAYTLRATVAHGSDQRRENKGLSKYLQITLLLGWINIAQDMAKLLRTMIVNSTYPHPAKSNSYYPLMPRHSAESDESVGEVYPDEPHARSRARRIGGLSALLYLTAIVLGIIAGIQSISAINDEKKADVYQAMRYASAGIGVSLTFAVWLQTLHALMYRPRVNRRAAAVLLVLCTLITTPGIYRLCIMYNQTDSLVSTGPGSLNSVADKATFYIFHVAPEYLTAVVMLVLNIREIFRTGPFGDWREKDETAGDREARLKKKAEKKAKKERKHAHR